MYHIRLHKQCLSNREKIRRCDFSTTSFLNFKMIDLLVSILLAQYFFSLSTFSTHWVYYWNDISFWSNDPMRIEWGFINAIVIIRLFRTISNNKCIHTYLHLASCIYHNGLANKLNKMIGMHWMVCTVQCAQTTGVYISNVSSKPFCSIDKNN